MSTTTEIEWIEARDVAADLAIDSWLEGDTHVATAIVEPLEYEEQAWWDELALWAQDRGFAIECADFAFGRILSNDERLSRITELTRFFDPAEVGR
jgi:hypothetical protein